MGGVSPNTLQMNRILEFDEFIGAEIVSLNGVRTSFVLLNFIACNIAIVKLAT